MKERIRQLYFETRMEPGLATVPTRIKIGEHSLQYSIPRKWSVNKLKCLLDSEHPKLNFDGFELCLNEQLLQGDHTLGDLESTGSALSLSIVFMKSQVSFQDYYREKIGRFMQETEYEQLPIFHPYMKGTIEKTFYADQLNGAEEEDEDRQAMEELELPRIFTIFRWIGLLFFLFILFKKGEKLQIGIIAAVCLCYLIIEVYSNRQAHKNQPRAPQEENQPRKDIPRQQEAQDGAAEDKPAVQVSLFKNILAEILLRVFKLLEICFCFVLTFFPNWDLNLHNRVNGPIIMAMRRQINQLRPGTFEVKEQ